jgi:hypothetical protein
MHVMPLQKYGTVEAILEALPAAARTEGRA